jgi:3-phytase
LETDEKAGVAPAAGSPIAAAFATDPLPNDADDPAVWVHPTDPSRSLVIGTDKIDGRGGLYLFGLDGHVVQTIAPLNRPNNVDVEYGFALGGGAADIVVATERRQRRLLVYRVRPDGSGLEDVSSPDGLSVLAGQAGEAGEPLGVALYRRPRDGAVFAIVSPKDGGATDYLWQYRLEDDGAGRVRGVPVRRFGRFSGTGEAPGVSGEIEAIVVDDELGFVYYADERFGIRKWHADPDHPEASRELAVFGTAGYLGDREGLAIYARPGGRGYLVSVDQLPGASRLHIYPREGSAGNPHNHRRLAVVATPGDSTDGIEVTSRPLPGFPRGLLVMMNSGPREFLVFPWEAVEARIPGAR